MTKLTGDNRARDLILAVCRRRVLYEFRKWTARHESQCLEQPTGVRKVWGLIDSR